MQTLITHKMVETLLTDTSGTMSEFPLANTYLTSVTGPCQGIKTLAPLHCSLKTVIL